MTHSHHRRGSAEDLREDYVLLAVPTRDEIFQVPDETQKKLRQIWEIFSHYEQDLTNFGTGLGKYKMEELTKMKTMSIAQAVFTDRETLKSCVKELKERDYGVSIVISGLYEDTEKICSELGFSPHTVEYSLDIHGKTERLPEGSILEITTMCGHAMVSSYLVVHLVERINKGKITCEKAAQELSRMCTCGIFNPYRAEKVLRKLALKE